MVSVLILNWNRRDDLVHAVAAALTQSYRPLEVVVADNGSVDRSVETIEDRFPDVRTVRLGQNYGCPGGRNRGIMTCSGDYVFFAEDDGQLHREAVAYAMQSLLQDDRIAVVGGAVRNIDAEVTPDLASRIADQPSALATTFHGGVALVRKDCFLAVGGFPDDYIYGGEEWNLSLRLLDAGLHVCVDPKVILYHRKAAAGRDRVHELVRRQTNHVTNRLELLPAEFALLYAFRTLLQHPLRAARDGMLGRRWLGLWLRGWPAAALRGLRRRKPIRRDRLRIYHALVRRPVNPLELESMAGASYARRLFSEVFGVRGGH